MKNRNNGFTLIEVIIVVSIFGAIVAFGLITTMDSFYRNTIQTEQSILVSALEKARSRSMNNMFESAHGVCYIAPNYVIFRTPTCVLSPINETVPANTKIADLSGFVTSLSPTNAIIFSQLAGTTTGATIIMTDGAKSLTTTINYEGTINW